MKKLYLLVASIVILAGTINAQEYLKRTYSVTVWNDQSYGTAITYSNTPTNLPYDWYFPTNAPLKLRPLIIFIHGGAFFEPNLLRNQQHIVAFCDSMAARGYLVASIDYRLDAPPVSGITPNRAVLNAAHDAKAAVRLFKYLAPFVSIDTNLIFVAGESAGAVTALNVSYMNTISELSFPAATPYGNITSVEGNSGGLLGTQNFSSRVAGSISLCGGTSSPFFGNYFDPSAMKLPLKDLEKPLLMVNDIFDVIIPYSGAQEILSYVNQTLPPSFYGVYTYTASAPATGNHCPWIFTSTVVPVVPTAQELRDLDTLVKVTSRYLHNIVDNADILLKNGKSVLYENKNSVNLFPNPNKGLFNLQVIMDEANIRKYRLKVFDLLGKEVLDQPIIRSNTEIDLTDQPQGIYSIKVTDTDGGVTIHKVVVQ